MFKVGDEVRIKKGIMQSIDKGKLSPSFAYVREMQCHEGEKAVIKGILEPHIDDGKIGYELENNQWNWNEDWLQPAIPTPLDIIKAESEVY